MPERIVLIGYGPVGARFVEELLPVVRAGLAELTVVGAESADAYNRVLIAEYAVGHTERQNLDITDSPAAIEAGAHIRTGVSAVSINRTRRTVSLNTGEDLPYDRLVLATGARANIPTLDGVKRPRRDRMRPSLDARTIDSADGPLPRGITVLRDLDDARAVNAVIEAKGRIVVLGAGVLGMEIALAAAQAGGTVCVVYHGDVPMARNLDRGSGSILARSSHATGITMLKHSRAESVLFRLDEDGIERFDAVVCADGKQIPGDLLLLSCGVGARTELAALAGLDTSTGVLVDEELRSWSDPRIFAIGDCAHVAPKPVAGASSAPPAGGPSGLIGPGWHQADWLAARLGAELADAVLPPPLAAERPAVVMLKAEGIDVVAVGNTAADPWDDDADHAAGCDHAPLQVSQWADPEHGRYVKMVTRDGVLEGLVCVGMPRAGAELTLLFERGSELPADRSVLLRYDGPDAEHADTTDAFASDATVCWCNGVTVGAIVDAAEAGNTTVSCIGTATRAGTGCGGCKGRIGAVLERFMPAQEAQPVP